MATTKCLVRIEGNLDGLPAKIEITGGSTAAAVNWTRKAGGGLATQGSGIHSSPDLELLGGGIRLKLSVFSLNKIEKGDHGNGDLMGDGVTWHVESAS